MSPSKFSPALIALAVLVVGGAAAATYFMGPSLQGKVGAPNTSTVSTTECAQPERDYENWKGYAGLVFINIDDQQQKNQTIMNLKPIALNFARASCRNVNVNSTPALGACTGGCRNGGLNQTATTFTQDDAESDLEITSNQLSVHPPRWAVRYRSQGTCHRVRNCLPAPTTTRR